jgi:hypothetical protein
MAVVRSCNSSDLAIKVVSDFCPILLSRGDDDRETSLIRQAYQTEHVLNQFQHFWKWSWTA